ncbi:MAG TPA: hypothetical protein H9912_10355 [Candidatus Eisenbergiella stercorigallinarum]|uniref:Uncharacterized protein n=1 Tax=Candidatus Eisenbergiella stercorigallinarum TaxID=2838557 RepID=A0A9D2R3U3_9FIRM|nr:hypothetical protein [Candidatus Eisenbergiella stercorigallinarum]
MSAYLSVTVHNAFGPGVSSTATGLKNMFETKYYVYLYIDQEEPVKLRAERQPHRIAVEPGAHTVIITRKPLGKTSLTDVVNTVTGGVIGGAVLGGVGAALGAHLGEKAVKEDGLKNANVLEFHEGEVIACEVKADFRGMPKVQWK